MSLGSTPHTRVHKGKRVMVLLRSGERIEDHFESYGSTWIKLRVYGKIQVTNLRALIIAREGKQRHPPQSESEGFLGGL